MADTQAWPVTQRPPQTTLQAALDWWRFDLPPMTGPLRFIFYTGLLYFGLTTLSPLTLTSTIAQVPPALRMPVRLLDLVGWGNPPDWIVLWCRHLCIVAWVCA